uniref:Uncharacterized protein n=1 Tax=Rhizophora mucronata TaxID=61149 RepID=A0A2P2R2C1_RHIMU
MFSLNERFPQNKDKKRRNIYK